MRDTGSASSLKWRETRDRGRRARPTPRDRLDKFLSKFAVKVDAEASSLSGTGARAARQPGAVRGRTARPPTRAGSAPITRESGLIGVS